MNKTKEKKPARAEKIVKPEPTPEQPKKMEEKSKNKIPRPADKQPKARERKTSNNPQSRAVRVSTVFVTEILKERQYNNFYTLEGNTSNGKFFFCCYDPFNGWLRAATSDNKRAMWRVKGEEFNVFEENIGVGFSLYVNSLEKLFNGAVKFGSSTP